MIKPQQPLCGSGRTLSGDTYMLSSDDAGQQSPPPSLRWGTTRGRRGTDTSLRQDVRPKRGSPPRTATLDSARWLAGRCTKSLLVSSLVVSSGEGFVLLGGADRRGPSFLARRPALKRYPPQSTGPAMAAPGIHLLHLFAPPGSGYAGPEDEVSVLPATYDPMMSFPGTMRPGKTPENMPFHDLPIGDNDPDPVPWPHFQQIEWHHRWEPPHEHPIPMEDFIELSGRWATPEMEAAMRAGVRQDVRERRELQESERRDTVITDDDDEDDLPDEPVALGDGMFGKLGSDADRAATAAATSPLAADEDGDEDDGLDFLLDLGLDMLEDDGGDELGGGSTNRPAAVAVAVAASRGPVPASSTVRPAVQDSVEDDDDVEYDDEEVSSTSAISVDVDDDEDVIDFGVDEDEDDEADGLDEVPLDDYGDNDGLDTDIFDEGGFDYDDYESDGDGGDTW